MKVTREVIDDLLPLYLAGEASRDTRALVEDFLRGDPELAARIRRARQAADALQDAPDSRSDLELKTLERTRRAVSWRAALLGIAIFASLMPLSVRFEGDGTHWLLVEAPEVALPLAFIAAILWGVYWKVRRSTRSAGV